jgi:putative glutamine amidotransferase
VDIDLHISDYAKSVAYWGGVPVGLSRDAEVDAMLSRLDGLVIAGGADVDPGRYGAEPSEQLGRLEPDRDAWELALLEGARTRRIPVLAICRGLQILNVSCGGTLHQHVDLDEGSGHPNWQTDGRRRTHGLATAPDSIVRTLLGTDLQVNSMHHQTVDRVGEGLRVTATAPDGVVEALEHDTLPMVGVQWHPELLGGDPMFSWIVAEARRYGETSAKSTGR